MLRDQLAVPPIRPHCTLADCDGAAELGQKLFFEPALSGSGTISCRTCHDPKRFYVDTRNPNNVSQTAMGYTKRNSAGLVDLAFKPRAQVFTWNGGYASPGAVLDLAVHKAMGSDVKPVADVVRHRFSYEMAYRRLFGAPPESETDDAVFANLELAFDAYLERLVSLDSPFDRWRDGDATALADDAQRGFAVFVGKGGCIDCHGGPMFSDFGYRNTGVPRTADNTVNDNGRYDVTHDPNDLGVFVTPMLRNVAQTGPYMHDGSIATLREVVELYRRGGEPGGVGTRDPRIAPLDLTDEDASDLVAFLEALTGHNVDPALGCDIRASTLCAP